MDKGDISRNLDALRKDPQSIIYMVLFNEVYKNYLVEQLSTSGKEVNIGPTSFGILNLMSRETLIINYEEQNWIELQNTIVAIWNAVQYNEFPLKANVYKCSQCEYFHHCASTSNEVSIITHSKIQSNDPDDIQVIVFDDNLEPREPEYIQKKLFRLPRKVLKEPKSKILDEGIRRVVIIE